MPRCAETLVERSMFQEGRFQFHTTKFYTPQSFVGRQRLSWGGGELPALRGVQAKSEWPLGGDVGERIKYQGGDCKGLRSFPLARN